MGISIARSTEREHATHHALGRRGSEEPWRDSHGMAESWPSERTDEASLARPALL